MTTQLVIWTQFSLCVALIGLAGVRLIRYGDALAALTGLSRSWIGLILIATVTSLPELVTGLSAVTVAASPDMAVGDALGSCIFNLAILAGVDVLHRRQSIYAVASRALVLPAGFGVILLSSAALVLLLGRQGVLPDIAYVSWGSVAIVLLYATAMRTLYLAERRDAPSPVAMAPANLGFKQALTGYVVAAAVIVAAGVWLPLIGVELAARMGWSNSFVGSLFVAFATSVPELATTWAAVRMGAIDMAFANLLGSNLFNVLILALDDMALRSGSLYAQVSPMHAVSAMSATLMSGTVVVALVYRPASRVWHIGSWVSLALLALYLLNAALLYLHGH